MFDRALLAFIDSKKSLLHRIIMLSLLNSLCNVMLTASLVALLYCSIYKLAFQGFFCIVSIGVFLSLRLYCSKGLSKSSSSIANFAIEELKSQTYAKLLELRFCTPLSTQEISQLCTEGIEQLRLYYGLFIPSVLQALSSTGVVFLVLVFLNTYVGLIYLLALPLIPLSIIAVSRWAKRLFSKYWGDYLALGNSFLDNIRGMKELRIFDCDARKAKEMQDQNEQFRKATMRVLLMQLYSITIMDFVAYFGAGMGIVLTLQAMLTEGLNPYIAFFMILLGAEFFLPLRQLGSAFHIAMNGVSAGKKILEILHLPPPKEGTHTLSSIQSITFSKVSFAYEAPLLEEINLSFTQGLYSIVGLSGSGKSTLAKLCIKLLSPQSGEILINGENIQTFSSSSLYQRIAYISHSSFLFPLSIKELFWFYSPNLPTERMIELLKSVFLWETLSQDLNFKLNPSLSNLSGGEKQRLILALYLSKDYDVYIFDEATSGIDKESEEIIIQAIKQIAQQKIVILISHRLCNTLQSRYIYFLQDCHIIEEGSPYALCSQQDSHFAQLLQFQQNLERI